MYSSDDFSPHFEEVDGRRVFFVDGLPFAALAAEIPWWHLEYGRYRETQGAYDYLYPAARRIGLNAIKVPVKWSMVEPEPGVYDFAYLDHVKRLADDHDLKVILCWFGHYASGDGNLYRNLTNELFAPLYIVEDEQTYPRAIDAAGRPHHNSASYAYDAVVRQEQAAFCAFLAHIKAIDRGSNTIIMIQVENEIAVFGADRRNRQLWRDRAPAAEQRFRELGEADDLRFSADLLSARWIRPLTDAGQAVLPIPFFLNFVDGSLAEDLVGGAPGEDLATYLAQCPSLSFIGLNYYQSEPERCPTEAMRRALAPYRAGRNLPAITETNSHRCAFTSRLAFLAIGECGAPLFAPWCLTVSYPTWHEPYVLEDGTIGNGAAELGACYTVLRQALAPICWHAGTGRLRVCQAPLPGEPFGEVIEMAGAAVHVAGEHDGQLIAVALADGDLLIAGYRCFVSVGTALASWPHLRRIRVERGAWRGWDWVRQGDVFHQIDQSRRVIDLSVDVPMVVRCRWTP